jgi:pilus assembly protein CpaC
MYDYHLARTRTARRTAFSALAAILAALVTAYAPAGFAQDYGSESLIRKISARSEKIEITTNTSRILTLDKNIPRVQVNNPELVAVTPLSAKDIQISARKAGVTQVNLWDEEGNIHTIDVLIYGDARELSVALQTQFPHSSIRVYRYSESLVLTGFVDRPDHVGPIMRLAEDYAPKVINNINVGGVQQVLLKVRVMEVSRTKLRQLGVDWGWFGGDGDFAVSRPNSLISEFTSQDSSIETLGDTFSFGIINDSSAFFGVLDALQNCEVAKILAEPNLVAVSGRPAQFNVGGEVPILIPQSLGTSSIEFKPFGTQVDFLPIVLGNGNIRLEVRPRISFLDPSNGIQLNEITVPGFNVRQIDTAVEMKAGQTFAIAGLVQERVESRNRGLPYLSDVPVLGVPFRRTLDEVNEIELLILVTPEFVDPMDACEPPCGGPGYNTVSPTSRQLYCAGHVEVPPQCNPTQGLMACGQDPCGQCQQCAPCGDGGPCGNSDAMITDGASLPGGVGYDESTTASDQHESASQAPATQQMPPPGSPDELQLPAEGQQPESENPDSAYYQQMPTYQPPADASQYQPLGHYTPPRQPVYLRNASRPQNPQPAPVQPAPAPGENGLIGPVGYDLQ